jgi:hypothetical protein
LSGFTPSLEADVEPIRSQPPDVAIPSLHEDSDSAEIPPLPNLDSSRERERVIPPISYERREPPPMPAASEEVLFIPYRYTVDADAGVFRIFARSLCSRYRKIFTLDAKSWSYLDMPHALENPARTVSILKDELSADRITFDVSTNHFIVEPSERITQRVREACRKIVSVPLTTFSILSRFGHRFFDLLHSDGQWAQRESPQMTPRKVAFHTVAFSQIDADTIAFIKNPSGSDDKPSVEVWSLFQSFEPKQHSRAAASNLTSSFAEDPDDVLSIAVKSFDTVERMVREFCHFVQQSADILIHYGESTGVGSIINTVQKIFSEPVNQTVEIFDLRDYVRSVYTDMPNHDFVSVINEVDLMPTNDKAGFETRLTAECISAISTESSSGIESLLPNLRTTVHSPENIAFFLEKIASKVFILSRLFSTLSRSAFDLSYISGCNISELTKPGHTSRGVVAFIDPIAAWSQIVDTLPHDYMDQGLHAVTYVTPFAGILIDNMCSSDHPLTVVVGRKIEAIRSYGWIVREIFSMRAFSPIPPRDMPTVFALFRGMLYSTGEIPGYEATRQWSSIINVGMNSWIGISMAATTEGSDPPPITFGYFGIEDVCRHPFSAMRTAVEMFLSLKICSNSSASPHAVATSTALTSENMAVRRRITSSNVGTFATLLLPSEAEAIVRGKKETTLNLWYRSFDKFTTNPIIADKKVYVNMLETMLTQSFGFIAAPPPPPPPPPEPVRSVKKVEEPVRPKPPPPKPPAEDVVYLPDPPTVKVVRPRDSIFPSF